MEYTMPQPSNQDRTAKSQIIVATFNNQNNADAAVQALREHNISEADISVAMRDPDTTAEEMAEMDTAADATGTDVAIGSAAGGLLGFAAGLALFSIPGLGPFLGAGVLAATLGGAALGSAIGERTGHLTALGLPEERAEYFHEALASGQIIVAVIATDPTTLETAQQLLAANGAEDVDVYPYQAPEQSISPDAADQSL